MVGDDSDEDDDVCGEGPLLACEGAFVFKRWSSERFGDPKAKLDGLISNINMLDLKEEMMVFLWRWHVREKN